MRKSDKKKNIQKVNLIAEERYLKSKGLVNESFHEPDGTPIGVDHNHEPVSEVETSRRDRDLSDEGNFNQLKDMLMNYLHQGRTNSAAMANDNKAILYDYLETMWSPQDLHMGANGNEIRTNNPELMQSYLAKHGISGKSFVK